MSPRSQYSHPTANRIFTNREHPIARFHHARADLAPNQHRILTFHGPGGQGKTALCRKFQAILAEDDPRYAVWGHLNLEVPDFREPAHGLLQLRKSLRESGKFKFTAFDIALTVYWEKAYPTEDPTKALKDLLGDSEGVLGSIADNAPSWLEMAQELPAGLGLGVKGLLYLRKKFKERWAKRAIDALQGVEAMDVIPLLHKLPYFLGLDLCAHRENTDAPLPVLFIDTYEALWSDKPDKSGFAAMETDAWMRELVASAPGVLFVIFGRERLSWDERFPDEWAGYLDNQHRLSGLADRDAEKFLCEIPVVEPELRRAMIEAAKGEPDGDESAAQREARGTHPFYLDLAVDIYLDRQAAGRLPQAADFGGSHAELLGRFLRYRSHEERETLKLLSVPRSFDEALFADLVREFGTHYPLTAFAEFTGFSFIEAGEDGRFRLHGVMRDQLYAALDGKLRARLESFLFDWYDARCQPETPREVTAEHELALREAVYHRDVEDVEAALRWFWAREKVFDDAARYGAIEPLYCWALDLAENRLGSEHPETAVALNNLALLLKATNRLADAEPLMRRALAIDENSFGPEHPEVAIDLNNLVTLMYATNRLADAEPLMRRALAIDENSYGPEHPNVAIRLNNLALLLQATNRLADAEPLMRRALVIFLQFTRTTGHEHPELRKFSGNYRQLLQAQHLPEPQIQTRLTEAATAAGYSAAEGRELWARLAATPQPTISKD